MTTDITMPEEGKEVYGVGLLGAETWHPSLAKEARLGMIERHILRIEMALRQAGIEIEHLDL